MSDTPIEEQVLHRVEDQVAWITINRPDAGNAITPDVRNRIIDLVEDAGVSLDVRAVVLTAVGEKHFCTGADLRAPRRADAPPPPPKPEGAPDRIAGDAARVIRTGIQRLTASIQDCEKPVLCALNGTAAGGGASMALSCDLIVASETARIIQVFVRRGLIPDGGGTYLLPRLVGLMKAKELAFFGDDLSAADAERLGIVNKVVPAAELLPTAAEWAARLASGPTRAIGFTKRLLNRSLDTDRTGLYDDEALYVEINTSSADSREGMMSFVERRPTQFRGF